MKKNSAYMTRALRSKDRRFGQVLGKLGYTQPLQGRPSHPLRVTAPVETSISVELETPVELEAEVEIQDEDLQLGEPLTPTPVDEPVVNDADLLTALREQYTTLAGKRPFNGWDKDQLLEKIVALEADKD